MKDAGKITICNSVNVAEKTHMPIMMLEPLFEEMFEERIIGINRHYAARGVNQEISAVVRIWRMPVKIGMYAVIEDSEYLDGQYRIDFVQPLNDYDGLKVCDLTLSAIEDNFAIKDKEQLKVVVIYGDDHTVTAEDLNQVKGYIPDMTSVYLDVDDGEIQFLLPDREWIPWKKQPKHGVIVIYSSKFLKDLKEYTGYIKPDVLSLHLDVAHGKLQVLLPGGKWRTWQRKFRKN